MKYITIVPDGAADEPIDSLGGKTPLEVAHTPFMDELARKGVLGRVRTVPPGFTPSSDVANLSLLGYKPEEHYQGRGPMEAANLGVELGDDDLAFRCNLVTESEGKMVDYSAGHITNEETKVLMGVLDKQLGSKNIEFYPGKSYRNLMVYRHGVDKKLDKLNFTPPHDIMGADCAKYLPRGKNRELIIELIEKSKSVLSEQEINKVRIDLGENPANMIWLWGAGRKLTMESFFQRYGINGGVISAVDLIKGLGKVIGLSVVEVPGATGYYDTNYIGKAEAALKILQDKDFVFVHIEATDEAGHNQDLRMKIACLERIDKYVVGNIVKNIDNNFRIMISPDHPTPVAKRTHSADPVPFLISGNGIEAGDASSYSEAQARNSSLYFDNGPDLVNYFFKK
jgi:2,3-bisphosphoglycerate-independent phosphoglycerate mutase